ncbi:hypothetical protein [Mycobacterium sp. 3519A]|uniref:hypothetical protein n=1 Tax=Mycobacterium sp. 3519A TaxID=2057184 RepID=UPI000C7D81AF|nr:hypothetical protein [Mycobacterium sp. 3519A]
MMKERPLSSDDVTAMANATGIQIRPESAAAVAEMLTAIHHTVMRQVAVIDQDARLAVCFDARGGGGA